MTMTSGVGQVETRFTTVAARGLRLDCGRRFGPITVAWEQYGAVNRDRTNVVLVCHALSGGAHAAGWHEAGGKAGWWDALIGPGRAFDTTRYCVVCTNVLGGCYGTTGPASVDPTTERPYGADFPPVTVWDMVRVQRELLARLGVRSLAAVAGGSMGGMQALAWAALFPDWVRSVVAIAATDRHSPQQIAFNEVARRAITADPEWLDGRYKPERDRPPASRSPGCWATSRISPTPAWSGSSDGGAWRRPHGSHGKRSTKSSGTSITRGAASRAASTPIRSST